MIPRHVWSAIARAALVPVLLCLAGVMPSIAEAHLKDRDGNWYFGGGTYGSASGTGARTDPVNVLFYAGGRVTPKRVTQHVADHTSLNRLAKRRCTGPQPFPTCSTKECNAGTQYMSFIHHKSDRRSEDRRRSVPGQTFDLESACGGDRYHSRLWDDQAHDEGTVHHRVKDWVVGNIHRDLDVDGDHVPGVWEDDEARLLKSMNRKHCVKKDWRFHPGSFKRGSTWRGRENNGKISLVTFAHNGEDTCPRETG